MHTTIHMLQRQLLVSCQASPSDPMEDTGTMRRVARSAIMGGGKGMRLNGAADVRAVRLDSSLPIIAIQKSYVGGHLRITPDFPAAASLAAAGADIIALDCTDRVHVHGEPWREIVRRIHEELGLLVMADIATLREGLRAAEAGVDLIGTTLNGYTEETRHNNTFNPQLVRDLVHETQRPIVAEGHIATPAEARCALDAGAWCVVVGSAITRPGSITAGFVRAMQTPDLGAVAGPSRYVLGVDIGGTSVKAAVVSDRGVVHLSRQVETLAAGGRDAIAKALTTAVSDTLQAAEAANIKLSGIGIASAGAIDARNATVFAATENLPGWAGFDLGQHLRSMTTVPIFAENDAHAAALAELHFGAGRGLRSFIAVTVGTGIGGGLVMDGRLQRGQFGFAGTVGHHTIRFDGRLCNCGRRGCLEAYVSTAGLIHEYRQLTSGDPSDDSPATLARRIARLSAVGDPQARAAYSVLARYLAEGIANVFNILDPEAVILSGGLVEEQPVFLAEVQTGVAGLLHFGNKRPPRLLHAEAGLYAGVQGAAASVLEQLQPR